jgi:hypothetical protein
MLARNPTSESSAVALALPGLADSTRLVLTARFRAAQGKGIASIIEMGDVLLEGKTGKQRVAGGLFVDGGKRLPHGAFTPWVYELLAAKVELSKVELRKAKKVALRKADLLMLLAQHPVISESCHWHAFPVSPRTLYEISLIRPKKRLLEFIANGDIHPGLTREEAVALRGGRRHDSGKFILSAALGHLILKSRNFSDSDAVHELHTTATFTPPELKAFGQRLVKLAKQWGAARA